MKRMAIATIAFVFGIAFAQQASSPQDATVATFYDKRDFQRACQTLARAPTPRVDGPHA
jgi:hypothetical protein